MGATAEKVADPSTMPLDVTTRADRMSGTETGNREDQAP
jgi:hypothetical protein